MQCEVGNFRIHASTSSPSKPTTPLATTAAYHCSSYSSSDITYKSTNKSSSTNNNSLKSHLATTITTSDTYNRDRKEFIEIASTTESKPHEDNNDDRNPQSMIEGIVQERQVFRAAASQIAMCLENSNACTIQNPRGSSPTTISTTADDFSIRAAAVPIQVTMESIITSVEQQHQEQTSFLSPSPSNKSQHSVSSILRKARYSPSTPTHATPSKPSSGQKVKGLWSPTVEICMGDHALPQSPRKGIKEPKAALAPMDSPFDNLRDETLALIFSCLPLADLLRAGRVSRRWKHEIHNTQTRTLRDITGITNGGTAKHLGSSTSIVYQPSPPIQLWERVDASSFIEETYDRLLKIAKRRKELQQQEQESIAKNQDSIAKASRKSKKIKDPSKWARLQTGLALGRILTSKKATSIRSLILHNVGTKLSANHLDDFLPSSILSSLKELTVSGFDDLSDTHVHVMLLASLGVSDSSLTKNRPKNGPRVSDKQHSPLQVLELQDCRKLTNKVLTSIAATCSHKRLVRLSLKGCSRIDSIEALSDLLVTKLVLPSSNTTVGNGMSNGVTKWSSNKSLLTSSPEQPTTNSKVPAILCSFEPPVPQDLPDPSHVARGQHGSSQISSKSTGVASLFAPPPAKPTAVASLFGPPPTAKPKGGFQLPQPEATPMLDASLFSSSSTTTKSMGVASLFAPPPSTFNKTAPIQPKPQASVASLFALPPNRNKDIESSPPQTHISSSRCESVGRSSTSSKSSLASLFDLPGTSPTRRDNAESIRLLPPPPSLTNNTGSMAVPPEAQFSQEESTPCSSPSRLVSKRYNQHRRSLSNGKLPFPSALLPKEDKRSKISNSRNITLQQRSSTQSPKIIVGSLRNLDLRGTAITPSNLVDCLWELTHHHLSMDRSWCKVWFESLHLGGEIHASSPHKSNDDLQGEAHSDNQAALIPQSWTSEVLERLETVLAMDEMERKPLSEDDVTEILYFARATQRRGTERIDN